MLLQLTNELIRGDLTGKQTIGLDGLGLICWRRAKPLNPVGVHQTETANGSVPARGVGRKQLQAVREEIAKKASVG